MTTTPAVIDPPRSLFVYAGTRQRNGQKPIVQLYRVTEGTTYTLGESFAFEPAKKSGLHAFGVVGGVYRVAMPGPDTISPSTALLVDRWQDASQVAQWNAEHGAVRLHQNVATLDSADTLLLDKLQAAYRRLPGPARGVFLARVINHITRSA